MISTPRPAANPHSSDGVPEGQFRRADVVDGPAVRMVATGALPSNPERPSQTRGLVHGSAYEPPGKMKDRTSSAHAAPARSDTSATDWRMSGDRH